VLAGRPGPIVTAGSAVLDGTDLLQLPPHERARKGLFLGLQQPVEVPGVTTEAALSHAGVPIGGLPARVQSAAEAVGLRTDLLERPLNVDLSGGERKRNEIVQLCVLRPRVAVLDEVDSGLDVDALDDVGATLTAAVAEWGLAIVAITHFSRLLEVLEPTFIHAFVRGRIVESGGRELATRIEREGYAAL
jgi:Fe-S cluster assembly ATP-binding protein